MIQLAQVHCSDCNRDGPATINSRNQTRCSFCYSLNVTAVESKPEPAPEVVKPERKPAHKGKGA